MLLRTLISLFLINIATASELLDKKMAQLPVLQSAFAKTATEKTVINNIPWKDTKLDIAISNQWRIDIKSGQDIQVEQLDIMLDNATINVPLNLSIKANETKSHFINFEDTKIQQILQHKTLLGIVDTINVNNLIAYPDGQYKLIKLTISYFAKNNYIETSKYLVMIFA